jgi:hypothetical protein
MSSCGANSSVGSSAAFLQPRPISMCSGRTACGRGAYHTPVAHSELSQRTCRPLHRVLPRPDIRAHCVFPAIMGAHRATHDVHFFDCAGRPVACIVYRATLLTSSQRSMVACTILTERCPQVQPIGPICSGPSTSPFSVVIGGHRATPVMPSLPPPPIATGYAGRTRIQR